MREKAANAGALFLIAKPFTEDTFKEHLDGVIA
jgi:two-component system chemotaxis response regulator CheY